MESNMQYLQTKVFGYSIEKNQYTLNVESGLTRTEIKQWVELFFGVKVIGIVIDFPERVKEQDALWNIQCITDV
jgi:ribosomal protein L23